MTKIYNNYTSWQIIALIIRQLVFLYGLARLTAIFGVKRSSTGNFHVLELNSPKLHRLCRASPYLLIRDRNFTAYMTNKILRNKNREGIANQISGALPQLKTFPYARILTCPLVLDKPQTYRTETPVRSWSTW